MPSVRTVPAWQCCSDYQTSQPGSELFLQPTPQAAGVFLVRALLSEKYPSATPSKAATRNSHHFSRQESPMLGMLRRALGISLKFPASELQCGCPAANKSVRERNPFREGMEKNTARRNNHVQSVRTAPAWQCCSDCQRPQPNSEKFLRPIPQLRCFSFEGSSA